MKIVVKNDDVTKTVFLRKNFSMKVGMKKACSILADILQISSTSRVVHPDCATAAKVDKNCG
jgi:hypothetical protein